MGSTNDPTPGPSKSIQPWMFILFGIVLSVLVALSVIYNQSIPTPSPSAAVSQTTPPTQSSTAPDLTVDANGLSKATVTLKTTKGTIRFKFYPADAPKTVHRIIELINQARIFRFLTWPWQACQKHATPAIAAVRGYRLPHYKVHLPT